MSFNYDIFNHLTQDYLKEEDDEGHQATDDFLPGLLPCHLTADFVAHHLVAHHLVMKLQHDGACEIRIHTAVHDCSLLLGWAQTKTK